MTPPWAAAAATRSSEMPRGVASFCVVQVTPSPEVDWYRLPDASFHVAVSRPPSSWVRSLPDSELLSLVGMAVGDPNAVPPNLRTSSRPPAPSITNRPLGPPASRSTFAGPMGCGAVQLTPSLG